MTEAMTLMEDFIANAKVDKDAYDKYVGIVEKVNVDELAVELVKFLKAEYPGLLAQRYEVSEENDIIELILSLIHIYPRRGFPVRVLQI